VVEQFSDESSADLDHVLAVVEYQQALTF